jgi:gluconate 5-dehydrogenase
MKLFDLSGKTAFVSGGSRGIGKAITLALAEAGANVAVGARTKDTLDAVVAQISEIGVRGLAVKLDVTQIDAIPAAMENVRVELGPIDILVNVAGTTLRQPLEEVEESGYDLIMNTNSKGPYFLAKAVRASMVERGGGKIINVGSLTTGMGLPKATAYAASKGALGQMTKGMAVELGPHNIQVNALAPGFIMTDLNAQLWDRQDFREWCIDRTPARRPGTAEDMVGTAVFLASAASDFVTGQVIYVDGGVMAGSVWPL